MVIIEFVSPPPPGKRSRDASAHDRSDRDRSPEKRSPLFPTPGAPKTAIFTSVNDDFFRRIPRMGFDDMAGAPLHNSGGRATGRLRITERRDNTDQRGGGKRCGTTRARHGSRTLGGRRRAGRPSGNERIGRAIVHCTVGRTRRRQTRPNSPSGTKTLGRAGVRAYTALTN